MYVCIFYAKTILFLLLDTHAEFVHENVSMCCFFFSRKVCENFRWCPWKKDFQLNVRILKFIKMYICDDLKIMLSYIHDVCACVFVFQWTYSRTHSEHLLPLPPHTDRRLYLLPFSASVSLSVSHICKCHVWNDFERSNESKCQICGSFLCSLSSSSVWRDRKREREPLKMHLWKWKDNEHANIHWIFTSWIKKHVYQFNLHNVCVVLIGVSLKCLKRWYLNNENAFHFFPLQSRLLPITHTCFLSLAHSTNI